jgi:hypothetical protein
MGWRRGKRADEGAQGDAQQSGDAPAAVTLGHGDASREAYRAALGRYTPAGWEVVERGQRDLLRLLVGRVPAETGAGVLFGLAVLFRAHPKGDDASRAVLATIVQELAPGRARTLLVTLADAWISTEPLPFDARPDAIADELRRAVRRLLAGELPPAERDALQFIAVQVRDEG